MNRKIPKFHAVIDSRRRLTVNIHEPVEAGGSDILRQSRAA